jgi:formate-dependent nitrite reductase membrane component NrfD
VSKSKPEAARRRLAEPPPGVSSYYGRPIVKPPVWEPAVAWYLFAGGLAGASASLALAARLAGNEPLRRSASLVSGAAASTCAPLLISDLGRPERFLHMLRVLRPTSPMSVGTWIVAAFGPNAGTAVLLDRTGRLPLVQRAAETVAGALGTAMSTYTAVLVSTTSIPAWHQGRFELPFAFAGSAAASAAGASLVLTSPSHAGPARRLLLGGLAVEAGAVETMTRRLGPLGQPYHHGKAGRYHQYARLLNGAAFALGMGRRRRTLQGLAGALALAGSACTRFAVYEAGFESAVDPRYVIEEQRGRGRTLP